MKKYFQILFILVISGTISAVKGDISDFKKIVEDYMLVNTIKASVTQYIYSPDGSKEVFEGNYYADSKGFIRIDYIRPESQTVVINNSGLFWYFNERNVLFRSPKNDGSVPLPVNIIPAEPEKGVDIISEGVRFYSFFKTAEVYSVTSKKNRIKLILWIDPVSKTIKKKYLLDGEGREIIKEEYTEHLLINGIYIPSRIEFKARTDNGIIHTITEYSGITVNGKLGEDLFKFKITPDMDVRSISDKK